MAMDISAARTSPDSDAETPPRTGAKNPMGFLAYSNGALKRHYPTAPAAMPEEPAVSYKECMRNHAASIGRHALDGCCEFMPSPATNSGDPTSLSCAACGCHRNFHRRDPDDPVPLQLYRHRSPPPPVFSRPHMLMALKKSMSGSAPATTTPVNEGGKHAGARKKRFRTKFSQEQKEKMYEFSEKLGWKLQKIDKSVIENFCNEVGVGKEVLKVWMHNNKNTLGRKESSNAGIVAGNTAHNNGNHRFSSGIDTEEKPAGNAGGGGYNGGDFKHVHEVSANGSSSSG